MSAVCTEYSNRILQKNLFHSARNEFYRIYLPNSSMINVDIGSKRTEPIRIRVTPLQNFYYMLFFFSHMLRQHSTRQLIGMTHFFYWFEYDVLYSTPVT